MGQTADELKVDIERRRESLSGTVDAIEDRVLPGRIIERRRQAIRGRLSSARDRVMGTRDDVTGQISDVAGDAASHMRDVTEVPERLADQTRGAPLIAGGVAFGVGVLLAVLLPETDAEQHVADMVQPQLEAVTDAAKDVGRQALETAQEVSQGAIEELKESASEHAAEVKDQAKKSGEQVRETAKDAAGSA